MSTHASKLADVQIPPNARIAIAAAKWNAHIVDVLLDGCVTRLKQLGLDEAQLDMHRVPGAFELPTAAKMFVDTRRFDAVILIGCVIRGDTYHFDVVANEAARGIQQVAVSSGIPCIFGILTVDTEQQALDRAGGSHGHAGIAAADAAVEMIALREQLRQGGGSESFGLAGARPKSRS